MVKRSDPHPVLRGFHPVVARWFARSFAAPSPVQRRAWPALRRGESTLLLAPTGSGKTLAAFLCAIDALYRLAAADELGRGVQVLYVSPLKALGNDIHRNLMVPLAGIAAATRGEQPVIRAAVRSGDTPQSQRQAMTRRPPHILITTPESLYLMLSAPNMRRHFRHLRTVIVDEIHAVCADKRGVHLALSLERLEALAEQPLQRVGCSATISPLDQVAAFLVGATAAGESRPCRIVDAGQRKRLDVLAVAPLPDFLEASNTALWASAYERLLAEIRAHRTTLIFANSRYKAERTALRLRELGGADLAIGVHHGSMSKEERLQAESDLKEGRLAALVCTSSLELGIDVGAVDLVYQLESPKTVAAALQRVGRAGHLLGATSKGRILVFDRGELLECGAICQAMMAGAVDAIRLPRGHLDVLAQQIAGAVSERDWQREELLALCRRAWPYRDLDRDDFEAVLRMCAGDYDLAMARPPLPLLLWDRTTDRLTACRGLAHVCAQCAGTIPENADYDVVRAGSGAKVGTLGAEYVDDGLRVGDVFVLGSSTWRMVGVRKKTLEVEEAPGATPSVPWWVGPIEPRSREVGTGVGRLRRLVAARIGDPSLAHEMEREYRLCPAAATAVVSYLREQQAACGVVPDHERFLAESWRDELGRHNLMLHVPFGTRILRTWAMAITRAAARELGQQWSANVSNDLILLTLADEAKRDMAPIEPGRLLQLVTPENLDELLDAACAAAAGMQTALRDAAVCALQIQRSHKGRRKPPWLLNHLAEELHAALVRHPDHPLQREVRRDFRDDRLDPANLRQILQEVAAGTLTVELCEVASPSPFAHELLIADRYRSDHQMGRERRAHLLRLHRRVLEEVLSQEQMARLLDERAIAAVELRHQRRDPQHLARDADELAATIRELGSIPARLDEVAALCEGDAPALLARLVAERRVLGLPLGPERDAALHLIAADRWGTWTAAFGLSSRTPVRLPVLAGESLVGWEEVAPSRFLPARLRSRVDPTEARREVVACWLRCHGPVSAYELANHCGWGIGQVTALLDGLVAAGGAVRGVYTTAKPQPQWVDRGILEEIHHRTLRYLKRELAACAPYEVVDFLSRWQHRHPAHRLSGPEGLRRVLRQLQGFEILQGAWESEILPCRVVDYRPEMLDALIGSGELQWRRVGGDRIRRGRIAFAFRDDLPWLALGTVPAFDGVDSADEDIREGMLMVREFFRQRQHGLFAEVLAVTGVTADVARRALFHLLWCGELTCDSFACIRHAGFDTSLSACYDLDSTPRKIVAGRMSAARVIRQMDRRRLDPALGRWVATERLVPSVQRLPESDVDRHWARQLLDRWGVVSRAMLAAEDAAPPWGRLVRAFKRLELLGEVQRGCFIAQHQGEQYGLPEVIELLRDCRARREEGRELGVLPGEPVFCLSNRDPVNLYTTSLEILDDRGTPVGQAQRTGNLVARLVVQAGQVLLVREQHSLAPLTRAQLDDCFAAVEAEAAARGEQVRIGRWNGWLVARSAVVGLLGARGYRCDGRGHLVWPGNPRHQAVSGPIHETYLPAYADPPPAVSHDRHSVLAACPSELRPLVAEWIDFILPEFAHRSWQVRWTPHGPEGRYGVRTRLQNWAGKTVRTVVIATPTFRDAERVRHQHRQHIRLARDTVLDEDLRQMVRAGLDRATELTDRFAKRR